MEACNQLASTGLSQYQYIIVGLVLLVLGGLVVRKSHHRGLLLVALLLMTGIVLAPSTYAGGQPENCIVQTGASTVNTPSQVEAFRLVQDSFYAQPNGSKMYALLQNDEQLSADSIDWKTITIGSGPDTLLQSPVDLTHPNDSNYICGTLSAVSFGVVEAQLTADCVYIDGSNQEFHLPLPETFTLNYTAKTISGSQAPSPAPIIIHTGTDPVTPIVVANIDNIAIDIITPPVQMLANDSTLIGSLNPASIDLDLSKPGVQNTVTYEEAGRTVTLAVDPSGNVTVIAYTGVAGGYVMKSIPYLVLNHNGDVSNVSGVIVTFPPV